MIGLVVTLPQWRQPINSLTFPCLVYYAIYNGKWRPTRAEKLTSHSKHVMSCGHPAIFDGAVEATEAPACQRIGQTIQGPDH